MHSIVKLSSAAPLVDLPCPRATAASTEAFGNPAVVCKRVVESSRERLYLMYLSSRSL